MVTVDLVILLSNAEEYLHGTNMLFADTDSDGMKDGWEVENNLNPLWDDSGDDYDYDGMIAVMDSIDMGLYNNKSSERR